MAGVRERDVADAEVVELAHDGDGVAQLVTSVYAFSAQILAKAVKNIPFDADHARNLAGLHSVTNILGSQGKLESLEMTELELVTINIDCAKLTSEYFSIKILEMSTCSRVSLEQDYSVILSPVTGCV